MKSTTYYSLILDESGSMADVRKETLKALNEQIEHCQNLTKKHIEQPLLLSLSLFNTVVRKVNSNKQPQRVSALKKSEYTPDGFTALLDAVGMSIADVEHELGPNDDVVMVILTDGMENASQNYTYKQISKQITRLKATERLTFSFLGADIDAWDLARRLNISRDEVLSFKKSDMHANMDLVRESMSYYIENKAMGEMKPAFIRRSE